MPPRFEQAVRAESQDTHIEDMLATARDLRELHDRIRDLVSYEQIGNDHAKSLDQMSNLFTEEYKKIVALIDCVNGVSEYPGEPQNLEEVLAGFPSTPLGDISEEYGLRDQVFTMLTKLQVQMEGVDVALS
jgi:hypothetical protein